VVVAAAMVYHWQRLATGMRSSGSNVSERCCSNNMMNPKWPAFERHDPSGSPAGMGHGQVATALRATVTAACENSGWQERRRQSMIVNHSQDNAIQSS
jgi:hypothetical protein